MSIRNRGVLWSCMLLFCCSCATPYHPAKNGFGYSDLQLGPDRFQIDYRGDGDTSLERANDFAMLRCAEVAQQAGFSYFAVVDTQNTSSVRKYTIPEQMRAAPYSTAPGYVEPTSSQVGLAGDPAMHPQAPYVRVPSETGTFFKPGTSLVIKCFAAKPDKIFTFVASEVATGIRKKYRL